jgi:hypothetical protein
MLCTAFGFPKEERLKDTSADAFQYSGTTSERNMVTCSGSKSMKFLGKGPGNTFLPKKGFPGIFLKSSEVLQPLLRCLAQHLSESLYRLGSGNKVFVIKDKSRYCVDAKLAGKVPLLSESTLIFAALYTYHGRAIVKPNPGHDPLKHCRV